MRRLLAGLWLLVMVAAAVHVAGRFVEGLPFQTDLMALLPVEDRDPVVARAKEAMADAVSRRVVVLVGHPERTVARQAASELRASLESAGTLAAAGSELDPARLGAVYFPHRSGLLADADRRTLQENRGEAIVNRTLSQVFGFVGLADSRLLEHDPFLLFPEFLKGLPGTGGKAFLDEGLLTIVDGGLFWIVVSGQLAGEPFALQFQDRFEKAWGAAVSRIRIGAPDLSLLRMGAIFHARAGASEALSEASTIAACSLAGIVLLMLLAFRSAMPLVLSVVAVTAGLLTALATCLLAFGKPHVSVLLFGAGLIGVTVDYSLHYFTQVFTSRSAPLERLRHVFPGITLGVGTTLLGYGALAVAPYPGLRQVAVFSGVGVLSAYLTVLLWFPLLDRARPSRLPTGWDRLAALLRRVWIEDSGRGLRAAAAVAAVVVVGTGYFRLTTDDDVRRQQALSPHLVKEQAEVLRLTGVDASGQFFLVEGDAEQQMLVREEALATRLAPLVATGAIAGWQSPASFVPSIERQRDNRRLVEERLERPQLAALCERLGMASPAPRDLGGFLQLRQVREAGVLTVLDAMIVDSAPGGGAHVVLLAGMSDPDAIRQAARGVEGVRFIDPTADVNALLRQYREQAVWLMAASAFLMALLLALRHGLRHGARIMVPPVVSIIVAPAVLALLGIPFTFFVAMALVLVLSIGVDYAIFCAETSGREPFTVAAVTLASLTTLLSFGLLALSEVAAVHAFGAAMVVGIAIAFASAPLAARRDPTP